MRNLTVFSLLALCLAPARLQAQTEAHTDILTGRVTDLTGKPIADAQVGATSLTSGLTRTHTTDAEGRYRIFFPETPRQYMLQVKRMGFSPVQRTVTRRTKSPEQMTIDVELGGAPLALSIVEINGSPDESAIRRERVSSTGAKSPTTDATVPNPVAEILSLKDTLHLSAVQIVALTDVADSLQAKNSALYKKIQLLLAKSREAGDAGQMAGTIAMMLEEASSNTRSAVAHAEKVLRPEQWLILPQMIRGQSEAVSAASSKQNQ
jgi:carboxypeptidase family protein